MHSPICTQFLINHLYSTVSFNVFLITNFRNIFLLCSFFKTENQYQLYSFNSLFPNRTPSHNVLLQNRERFFIRNNCSRISPIPKPAYLRRYSIEYWKQRKTFRTSSSSSRSFQNFTQSKRNLHQEPRNAGDDEKVCPVISS